MDIEEFKKLVKDNIVIDTEYENHYSSGNNIVVSLRFDDEDQPFTSAVVFVPEDE